ncbi:hypothetical protein FQN57_000198 [Myotisia sp. PD_48]|nr:hypothetical protein FQN57_000198 [Myotisia sp. PD_48]
MPRPRVPLSQRQRVVEACNFCRVSKKRCSATVPCTACVHRGRANSCFFSYNPRRSQRPASVRSRGTTPEAEHEQPSTLTGEHAVQPEQVPQLPSLDRVSFQSQDRSPFLQSNSRENSDEEVDAHRTQASPARAIVNSPQYGPRSRMLRNLCGERVYIGGAASITFLQLIRDTVAENIGPSQFSHNNESDNMLEIASPQSNQFPFYPDVDLDLDQKRLYAPLYHTATVGYLDVLTVAEVDDLLRESGSTVDAYHTSSCKKAIANLIVAIGAQSCKTTTASQQTEVTFFCQAQRHAFEGMLENPNIDMVRAFILMAYYMLGACRRNAAFMYLGVATRAAVALGLHSPDSYAASDREKYQSRLRVWRSLYVLDAVVSSILGRPSATSSLRSELDHALNDDSEPFNDPAASYLLASYNICIVINDIVDELYGKKEVSITVAKKLLKDIEKWSQKLPNSIRQSSSSGPAIQGGAIGSIHVSCLYYFAVTLVTRPFLISTLISQDQAHLHTPFPPVSSTHDDISHAQLAGACLDAAIYLIETCVEAHKADILLGNIALVFAAGLILGFHMFAKREVDPEVELSFGGAREVLDMLSAQSPQAGHYFEILTMLMNAIVKQRQQLASRGRSKYVSKLFTLNGIDNAGEGHTPSQSASASEHIMPTTACNDDAETWRINCQQAQTDLDRGLSLQWNSLNLPLWDSFPFVNAGEFDAG